jgi:transketolase
MSLKIGDRIPTRGGYGEALLELGKKDEDVVALDADLSCSTKSGTFAARFPDRFFNMGVAEQNMVSVAAGLALAGKKPFASTFAIFMSCRVLDQVRNSIAYPKLNVKLTGSHGGLTVGEDGASHQPVEDLAVMRSLPNMTVLVPSDYVQTKVLVRRMYEYKGPVYMRTCRAKTPVIYDPAKAPNFPIGGSYQHTDGDDVAIISLGIMTGHALKAADKLEKEDGIKARVIDAYTLKPIDKKALIKAAKDCGAVVTVEEANVIGGLGGAVSEILSENYPVPLKRIGIQDKFGMSGKPFELLEVYGLSDVHIAKAAKGVLKRK